MGRLKATAVERTIVNLLAESGPMEAEEVQYQLDRAGQGGNAEEALAYLERDNRVEQLPNGTWVPGAGDEPAEESELAPPPGYTPPPKPPRECERPGCSEMFRPLHGNQKYHSQQCRLAAQAERAAEKNGNAGEALGRALKGEAAPLGKVLKDLDRQVPEGPPEEESSVGMQETERDVIEATEGVRAAEPVELESAIEYVAGVEPAKKRAALVDLVGVASAVIRGLDAGDVDPAALTLKAMLEVPTPASDPLHAYLEILLTRARSEPGDEVFDRIENMLEKQLAG